MDIRRGCEAASRRRLGGLCVGTCRFDLREPEFEPELDAFESLADEAYVLAGCRAIAGS